MFNRLLRKVIHGDFVIIDSQFPQKIPLGFRNTEINQYIKRVRNIDAYTMYPMLPDSEAWFQHGYGMTEEDFKENIEGYRTLYPYNVPKVHLLNKGMRYQFKLAYSFFLAETYTLLPFYEQHEIPFVFVLYPGGAFGLNFVQSNNMLRKIFKSKYFKGVIVTQRITEKYLVDNALCPTDQISYIYGGIVQFKKDEIKKKKQYIQDKKTFDICFVAAKYSNKGVDKGYDLFIAVAHKLATLYEDVRFHVVGGFTEEDIDISKIQTKITFYGYRPPDFFPDFYSQMEIFLAPNRPFELYEGNFDGFPLGIDAQYCGTAIFTADELNMNVEYSNEKDIIITSLDPNEITQKISYYYSNPEKLYELSLRGQEKCQELFDIDYQIEQRLKCFQQFVKLELTGR